MYTSFHLKANELNEDFLKSVKALFKSKRISIIVEEELDETEYLLSTPANRKHLEASLTAKEGYSFSSVDELKKHSKASLKNNGEAVKSLKKVKLRA